MCQSRMATVHKATTLSRKSVLWCAMEDFNPDDPLKIDAKRDENKEEDDYKATKIEKST